MRTLFLGDLVGRPGHKAVVDSLAKLAEHEQLDFVIVNAENAADGAGLTTRQFEALVDAGVDVITMGDHIYKRMEIKSVLAQDRRIIKPANFPPEAPGRDHTVVCRQGGPPVAVISLLGRTFMRGVDCPFRAVDRCLDEIPPEVKLRFVDVHAEATSDKQSLGRYLDGRVTAVLGTHTHVPTADACLLPGGTAYQTDLGMTGPYESIIGRDIQRVLGTTITFEPVHFHVATADVRMCGAIVEADPATGRAIDIRRFERRLG